MRLTEHILSRFWSWHCLTQIKKDKGFLESVIIMGCSSKRYGDIVEPLADSTRKSVPAVITWNNESLKDFGLHKQMLSSAPVLMFPDVAKPFILYVDASGYAVWAFLGQTNALEEEHAVTSASEKLADSQSKWAVVCRSHLLSFGTEPFWLTVVWS